jgi:hypothetical protein
LDAGRNVLAAEVHQFSSTSSDISFDFRLTAVMRTPTPGDIDFDGDVDRHDAATLAKNFGLESGALWIDGDFNADGAVDLADQGILLSRLSPNAASSAAVPEPAAVVLVLPTVAALVITRRRRARGD